jgi:hypothetical protein
MKNKCCWTICLPFIALVALSIGAFGQNMAHTVRYFDVEFPRGKNQTVRRGKADYAMSYVYRLKARKGQLMVAEVESSEKELTFSIIAPKEGTVAGGFGVKRWSGRLQESEIYKLVLVMNNETAKNVRYRLRIKIEGN